MDNWQQTYSGDAVFFEAPDPRHIHLTDIVHSLSKLCRFNGHCRGMYSVLQHSCHVYELALADLNADNKKVAGVGFGKDEILPKAFLRQCLLHDAHEAYLGDVVRPLKCMYPEIFKPLEERFDRAIFHKFNVPYPLHRMVKYYDNVMLATEAHDLMAESPLPWVELPAPNPTEVEVWPRKRTLEIFLSYFERTA